MLSFIKDFAAMWQHPSQAGSQEPLYHALANPVDAESMPVGAILDGLDDKRPLNLREGQLYTFPGSNLSETEDTRSMMTCHLQENGDRHICQIEARRVEEQSYVMVTAENCLEAVEASDAVQEWFKATDYRRPAYLVVGRRLVPLPAAGEKNDGAVGRSRWTWWDRHGRVSVASADADGKVFAVQLMKIWYQRPLLGGPRIFLAEAYSARAETVI